MPAKILFNSPTPELTVLCREVVAGLKIEVEVIEGVFDEGAELVRQAVSRNPGIEVLISRDATSACIQKVMDLPVVQIAPTDSDYFSALRKAREHGQRIGMLAYQQDAKDLDLAWLSGLLHSKIEVFPYVDREQFQAQIAWAGALGIQVMVMRGALGARLARKAGMVGVVVQTRRNAVVQALERAATVIQARKQEREKSKVLQTIMDHVYDGVIAVDKSGNITLCNLVARRMLGIDAGVVIDGGPPALSRFLEDRERRQGFLLTVANQRVVANRAPIEVDGETVGTVVTFQNVIKIQRMEERVRKELYSQGLVAKYSLDEIIGHSPLMQAALVKARAIASIDGTVLLIGESGTGKELFAQGIHSASTSRKNGPFVAVNCAALPETLLESELFGYESGAFTGARKGGKSGLFELAHGGTIFLDEIGTVPLDLQTRLLRVLQERQVMRIGSERLLPIDIRVIAASNENLNRAISENRFRRDLYYRLNILRLSIPSLRDRRDDIPLLVEHFLQRTQEAPGTTVRRPSQRLQEWFYNYHWLGNVRELENILERYVVWSRFMDDADFLRELESETETSRAPQGGEKLTIDLASMDAMEKQIFEQAMERVGGNRAALARILGISRTTIWHKLKRVNDLGSAA